MRKLGLVGAAVAMAAVTLAGPVSVAKMRDPGQPALPMWQGLYIGAHIGGAFGDFKVSDPTGAVSWDHGGFVGGAHAGYNLQFNQFVVGVEADIDFTNADGRIEPIPGLALITESKYLASVRGRLGMAFGHVLVYATGGYGFGDFKARLVADGLDISGESQRMKGFVFGGGIEAKISQSISPRLEALHYSLGRKESDDLGTQLKTDLDQTVIRAGITLHLN